MQGCLGGPPPRKFPTLTCGVFVFSSVSAPPPSPSRPPSSTLTHSLTHALTHSLTHSCTHSLTHSVTPPLLRGRRGTMRTAKGSDVRPGVPWVSASFAWQAWHNVHCQGVGCTPWRPLGLRLFCVAGVAQCALPSGVGCTPWRPLGIAWQAWHNVHCQGVGCTPWRPLGLRLFCVAGVAQCALPRGRMYALASLGSPPLLRGRRGTMCTAKGSDVRPGVSWVSASFAWQAWHNVHCQGVGCTPWRPLGLRLFCVAGVAQCALPSGVGCTPWRPLGIAWQAWHNVHCQGVGCTPWRPLGLRLFCVAGVAQCALPRVRMYALASLGYCVAGVAQCALPRGRMYALASLGSPPLLRGRRGTMCTAKGSDVRPGVPWVSASFAWQAWHNVHCQGVGCTPWRPLGLRLFCVAGVGQCALPRARMYALASLGSPLLLRGRRGTMCTAKGSDVCPGVPWVSASFAWLTHTHSLTHSHRPHSHHSHTPHSHHSLTLSLTHLYMHIHTHTPSPPSPLHHPSSLTHHHPSTTLILPLPFLLFYAQSKSREVGNMWGYPVL